jgi:hypothetical protein
MRTNFCVERAKNKRLASKCSKEYSCSKEPYNTVSESSPRVLRFLLSLASLTALIFVHRPGAVPCGAIKDERNRAPASSASCSDAYPRGPRRPRPVAEAAHRAAPWPVLVYAASDRSDVAVSEGGRWRRRVCRRHALPHSEPPQVALGSCSSTSSSSISLSLRYTVAVAGDSSSCD